MESNSDIINFIAVNWGNLASVAGLVVSLIGFWYTVRIAKQAKTAAERAEETARKTHQDLLRKKTIADFSEAISFMEELVRLHIGEKWEILNYRYPSIIKILISIKVSSEQINEKTILEIQDTITILRNNENQINEIIYEKNVDTRTRMIERLNIPYMNYVLTKKIGILSEILAKINSRMTDIE